MPAPPMRAAAHAAARNRWLSHLPGPSFYLAFAALSMYATVRVGADRGAAFTTEANFTELAKLPQGAAGDAAHEPKPAAERDVLIRSIAAVIRKSASCDICRPRRGRDFLLNALDSQDLSQLMPRLKQKTCHVWWWDRDGLDLATVYLLLELAAYAGDKLATPFQQFLLDFIYSDELDVLAYFQYKVSLRPARTDSFDYHMLLDLRNASIQFQSIERDVLTQSGERVLHQWTQEPITTRDQLNLWFRVGAIPDSPSWFGCFVDERILEQNRKGFARIRGRLAPLAQKRNFLMVGMMRAGFYLAKLMDTGFIGSNILKVPVKSEYDSLEEKKRQTRRAIQEIIRRFELRDHPMLEVHIVFLDAYMTVQTSHVYATFIPNELLNVYSNVHAHFFWIRERLLLLPTLPAKPAEPVANRYSIYVEDVNYVVGVDMPCIVDDLDYSWTSAKQPFRVFDHTGQVRTFHNERDADISFHHLKRQIWPVEAMVKTVTVRIISATGLINERIVGTVSPRCAIRVGAGSDDEARTSTESSTVNPVWNENLVVEYDVTLHSMQPYLKFIVEDVSPYFVRTLGKQTMGSEQFLVVGDTISLQLRHPTLSINAGILDVQIMRVQETFPFNGGK